MLTPAPTPPDIRVRVWRFLIVPKDFAALSLCPADAGSARPIGLNANPSPVRVDTADQVQPFLSGETLRGVPRLVALGRMTSADVCPVSSPIAGRRARRCRRARGADLPE